MPATSNSTLVSPQALGPLVNDLSRLLRREFDRRLRSAGIDLGRSQWLILYHVARQEGLTQSELADILDLERMTVCRHAMKLESGGWLERRDDGNDRRIQRLYLRPKAIEMLRRLEPLLDDMRGRYFGGISESRREALMSDLLLIRDNLLRSATPADPSFS